MLFTEVLICIRNKQIYVLLITRPEVKMQGKINETFPAESFALFYIVVFCNIN